MKPSLGSCRDHHHPADGLSCSGKPTQGGLWYGWCGPSIYSSDFKVRDTSYLGGDTRSDTHRVQTLAGDGRNEWCRAVVVLRRVLRGCLLASRLLWGSMQHGRSNHACAIGSGSGQTDIGSTRGASSKGPGQRSNLKFSWNACSVCCSMLRR